MKILLYLIAFTSCTSIAMAQSTGDSSTGNFMRVETRPEPPYSLEKYVAKNLHYPTDALKKKLQGIVKVKFMVMETGEIKYPTVVTDTIGGGLEQEAVRVIEKMPAWTPGKIGDRIVRTYYVQPISFTLENKSQVHISTKKRSITTKK